MLLSLQTALVALLRDAFPAIFGGAPPAVAVEFPAYEWTFDASSADATAGEPAPDDARDVMAFDPESPGGPYALSRPPYPGPRRVYLRGASGARLTLAPAEVRWDPAEPRAFTLAPRPARVLAGLDEVEVLYGVTAVATKLTGVHAARVLLTAADDAAAERALALALAAFALNRAALVGAGAFTETGGDYVVRGAIKTLTMRGGSATATGVRSLTLDAEVELKVSRALGTDEGTPIERILSPGASPGTRPVDVRIDVEA